MIKTKTELIDLFKREISAELSVPLNEVNEQESFLSLGLDSVTSIFILDRLEKHLPLALNPIWFWEYPTIELFCAFLTDKLSLKE